MKRIASLVMTFGFLASAAGLAAQDRMLGFRVGVTSSNVSSDATDLAGSSSRTGFSAGAFLNFGLGGKLSVQPEVNYVQKGFSVDAAGITGTAELNYIDIPVLLKLNLGTEGQQVRPSIFAGGFVGFEAGCSVSAEVIGIGSSTDCDAVLSERESFDAGVLFGAGVDIEVSDGLFVVFDGRYNLGLTDLDSTDLDSAKSRVWSFTGGLAIPLGS